MSTVTINVAGLDQLRKALLELPDRLATNSLQAAVGAGAAVIRDEARSIAPEYHGEVAKGHPPPGTLKRAIIIKAIRELSTYYKRIWFVTVRHGKKYQRQGKRGNLSQDAYYWWWVENGHYYVPPGKANSRRKGRNPGGAFVPAQPFMRPAFERKKMAAVEAIKAKLREAIDRHTAELKA